VADELIDKNPVWNSEVPNSSGENLLESLENNDFQISVPQCPTCYTPQNGDMLHIALHHKVWLTDVTVSNILDLDQLPIIFHILNHNTASDFF